jgi:hypothetical protein
MTSTIRNDSYDHRKWTQGSYYNEYLGTQTRWWALGACGTRSDVVGNQSGDNPLTIIHDYYRHATITGHRTWGTEKRLTDWRLFNAPDPIDGRKYFKTLSNEYKAELATEIAAGTNPGVAHVSVPSFVGELGDMVVLLNMAGNVCNWTRDFWRIPWSSTKAALLKYAKVEYRLRDLPYLLWCRGVQLMRLVAAGNISWKFAVAPMVGDLHKMFNFTRAVELRMRELRALQATGKIRRRMMLGYTEKDWTLHSSYTAESASAYVDVNRFVKATQSLWGTARWHLDDDVSFPTLEHELLEEALRLTYGITKFELLKAAWELTPWSWLCDWFTNVSTWLDACNNTLPIHLDGLCLMRLCTSLTKYQLTNWWDRYYANSSDTIDQAYERRVIKERHVLPTLWAYLPTPPSLPALSIGQMSIVGSLSTLKLGRWNLKRLSRNL